MEAFQIKLNDAEAFDAVLKNSLPECGDIRLITKDGATETGRSLAMITFSVQLPDGSKATAQAVTTLRLLRTTCAAIMAAYNDEGLRNGPINRG